ncbi:MAG: hypothetical protein MZU95_10375 [Desulfomicrobium escambiense]|nr:hypothetical protein [Desulfomicrobium escambiense]
MTDSIFDTARWPRTAPPPLARRCCAPSPRTSWSRSRCRIGPRATASTCG